MLSALKDLILGPPAGATGAGADWRLWVEWGRMWGSSLTWRKITTTPPLIPPRLW